MDSQTPAETTEEMLLAIAKQYGMSVEEVVRTIDEAAMAVLRAKNTFH